MLDIGGNIIALVLVHCKIAYICVYIITGYQKVDMSIDFMWSSFIFTLRNWAEPSRHHIVLLRRWVIGNKKGN